ncbi:MAG: polysaccharide deacetylase family protein [Planctomycetota bacterium]
MQEGRADILDVVLSMDCLPAGGRGPVMGPERWDDAEAAMLAFAEAADRDGLGATFFVAPQAMKRLRGAARQVSEAGSELGLLCHPQLSDYHACLGSYSYDHQREIVSLARKLWEEECGEPAETFRSGFFSANDYTFHVLCMEGFKQGSCSLPGRMDSEQCSMWFGSFPFPHHTDPLDRTQRGTMEFFEVPVSSDFDAAFYLSYETYTPPHLRIEAPDIHDYAQDLVCRQLSRMETDAIIPRTVHLVTSNLVGWGKDDDPHIERLHNLCAMLREAADEQGLEVAWKTLARVHAESDEEVGSEWRA